MSIFPQSTESITDAVTRATPAVTVSGLTFWGVALPDFVQILTAIYVSLLVVERVYRIYRSYKDRNKQPKNESEE